MAFNPKFTIIPTINKALIEIERVRGFLEAIKLKDDWSTDPWDAKKYDQNFLK